ncbi:glycoside hydrolase family 45 protein [Pleurotus ostreatus PC15]|uniref:Cellulase n=1 Tax=Pleurotus ostreatus (strain PC15) TaxID=1137138 RepID=A0A067NWQ3_PLEO1|nr:glycoside hydrolase family 45 protein [Pleurotus ostreatus PC15]
MFKSFSLLSLVFAATALAQQTGKTTRYWDCCKPSCSWSGKASLHSATSSADVTRPVLTCNAQGSTLTDPNVRSGCDGGSAFTCTSNSPWAVNDDLAYGFAAVSLSGSSESKWCCGCYELTFTSGPVAGKRMVVQATNTGGDLGSNHFDLLMPGGGVGIFNGCPAQFGSWNGGAQYGGVSSRSECSNLPAAVQAGCHWRFDWFKGADNPSISFREVQCPAALTDITGCSRRDGSGLPAVAAGPSTPASSSLSTPTSSKSPSITASAPTSSKSPSITTSTSTSCRSSSPPTTSSDGTSGGAPQWGQCGGIG